MSLGETLRRARENRGIDIARAAEDTSIRKRVLEDIESDAYASLPAPYLKSFVKKYAHYLNLQEEDYSELLKNALPKLEQRSSDVQLTSPSQWNETYGLTRPSPNVMTIAMYSGLGIALLIIGWYFFFSSSSSNSPQAVVSHSAPALHVDSAEQLAVTTTEPVVPDSVLVSARATENVWMSVSQDKQPPASVTMLAGQTKSWKIHDSFHIRSLGNAGGIVFTVNGKQLEKLGSSGQVLKDLRLTKQGIFLSNGRDFQPTRNAIPDTPRASSTGSDPNANQVVDTNDSN